MRAVATAAVRTLAAGSPAPAIEIALRIDIGRDDGSLEHLVQIWAAEDPVAASRWIDSQPRARQTPGCCVPASN
jgi:hypothetical protein